MPECTDGGRLCPLRNVSQGIKKIIKFSFVVVVIVVLCTAAGCCGSSWWIAGTAIQRRRMTMMINIIIISRLILFLPLVLFITVIVIIAAPLFTIARVCRFNMQGKGTIVMIITLGHGKLGSVELERVVEIVCVCVTGASHEDSLFSCIVSFFFANTPNTCTYYTQT